MGMIFRRIAVLIVLCWAQGALAYVVCDNVPVEALQSADGPGFHNFSEIGVTGATLFVEIGPSLCSNSSGELMANRVFAVLDNLDSAGERKKIWISMLMTAKVSGRKILLHAHSLGVNARNFQVLSPYYIQLK
jgi:hypothetical protein